MNPSRPHRLSRSLAACAAAWLALAAACNKSNPPTNSAPPVTPPPAASASPAPAKEAPAVMPSLIPNSELEACLEEGGSVALVVVKSSRVNQPGTRAQETEADIEIERAIHGPVSTGAVTVVGYSAGSEPSLAKGKKYVLAFSPDPGVAPRQRIEGFAEAPAGAEAAAVEAHAKTIAEIKPANP